MRTDKQKQTSRLNGANSRGPVTETGQLRSSQNAAKHHITSQRLLVPGESEEELDQHFASYRERFQPADAVECDLVRNLAFIAWRQHRLWRREADLITTASEEVHERSYAPPAARLASAGWQRLAQGPVVALLHREEASLRRAFDRTLKNLLDLQSCRPEPPPPSDDDAKMQNEPEPHLTACEISHLPAPAPVSENGIGSVSHPPQPDLATVEIHGAPPVPAVHTAVSENGIRSVPSPDDSAPHPRAGAAAKYYWSQC